MIIKDHPLSVRRQCDLLQIRRSALFYCPKEAFDDSMLRNRISEINQLFPHYAYRKIHWYLASKDSYLINRKKVQRLMRIMGIKAIFPAPKTSTPRNVGSIFPYLLKDLDIDRSNQAWSIDITYIKLLVGMAYLFALIDWYNRFVVGCKLVNTMEACHALDVMEEALLFRIPQICNADQGS